MARTSLILGLAGWFFYGLQACFDLSLGLVLAAVTGGMGAVCSSVLDVLPFSLWLAGIVTGHVALGQIKRGGGAAQSKAVWSLVLNYLGLFLGVCLAVGILILIGTAVGAGLLNKVFPLLHKAISTPAIPSGRAF